MFGFARCVVLSTLLVGWTSVSTADGFPADRPVAEAIDHFVAKRLQAKPLESMPRADDATLCRRLYLDLAGRIPSPRELQAFVESDDPRKVELLVDRLMGGTGDDANDEFVQQMAREFDVFMTSGNGSVRPYLEAALRENYGWDRVFRETLLGDPRDETQQLAYDFLKRRVGDTDKLTNEVSVVFFGINVSCMKCHDHPLADGWYQDHFYGMKSFFNRTFANGDFLAERDHGIVEYKTVEGETKQAQLMFLTGTTIDEPEPRELSKEDEKREKERFEKLKKEKQPAPLPDFSRRRQLVELVLDRGENDHFAKSIANRVWHQFIGHGIVMPLDQLHAGNPPSHPELLDWLATDLESHGYDLRRLVRGIVLSDVYARGSQWREADDRPLPSLFAVANVRPLTPTQYARSLALAGRDPREFEGENVTFEQAVEKATKAAGTGNSNWFEQPGEDFAISADEALRVTNDPNFVNTYARGGLFNKLKEVEDLTELVHLATRNVLCRDATDEEVALLTKYLEARPDRREDAIQQVLWMLLASTEMRFNH